MDTFCCYGLVLVAALWLTSLTSFSFPDKGVRKTDGKVDGSLRLHHHKGLLAPFMLSYLTDCFRQYLLPMDLFLAFAGWSWHNRRSVDKGTSNYPERFHPWTGRCLSLFHYREIFRPTLLSLSIH
jgi:hypothetical protein